MILAVEDNDTDYDLLKTKLEAYNHEIKQVKNVVDTFDAIKELNPTIIILDIRLQIKYNEEHDHYGGIIILERLLEEQILGKIPCFITSAYTDDQDIEKRLEKYKEYIKIYKKPFRVRTLVNDINGLGINNV